jgi:copper chaperone NosL
MGTEEAVPFSSEADAKAFAETHGGRLVSFDAMPKDYILGSGSEAPTDGSAFDPEANSDNAEGHDHG